jgi:peptide/nickel transport system permease protein
MSTTGAAIPAHAADAKRGYAGDVWRRLRRDRGTVAVLALLGLLLLLLALAPLIAPHDPLAGSVLDRLQPVGTPGHPLGTDEIGRDMLSRLLHGGRLSLLSGLLPLAAALAVGGTLGLVAGYAGGWLGSLIMRVTDVFYAFPSVLLAVALAGVLGGGLANTVIALAVVFTPSIIRVTETLTASVASADYVRAARATGAGTLLVLQALVLPNVLGPVLVYAASLVSTGILLGAGLSFLGLGVQPPAAEWGAMLNALRQAIYVDPLLAMLPGVAILFASLLFNLACDGLRGALDVRLPGR